MRLSSAQMTRVQEQFGTEALADDHPAIERLKDAFGDHTFFLDSNGLNIVEDHSDEKVGSGSVMRLATWTEDRKNLQAHKPELLPVTVELGDDGADSAD